MTSPTLDYLINRRTKIEMIEGVHHRSALHWAPRFRFSEAQHAQLDF